MTLIELCEKINLQEPVREAVVRFSEGFDFESVRIQLDRLKIPGEWENARFELEEFLEPDAGCFKMLSCMLVCAAESYEEYVRRGIAEDIYIDTMKCFPRFIEECKEKTGKYAFDRAFWTVRQIGMRLFRIGALEYEATEFDGAWAVSIHIPSDADLSEEACELSFRQANALNRTLFPDTCPKMYICDSWLLAPALRELLPPEAKIIQFQNRFEIIEQNPEGTEYLEWVYRGVRSPVEELPEHTTLQKKMKEYLLSGGKIGEATGILRECGQSGWKDKKAE